MKRKQSWNSNIVHAFRQDLNGRTPEEAVRKMSSRLLRQFESLSPPFRGLKYAELLGIRVIESDISCEGVLCLFGNGFLIQVRRDASPQRKNFTICHELGHALTLTHARSSPLSKGQLNEADNLNEEERLADIVSAELLMPRRVFCEMAADMAAGIESLERLSESFGTSLAATAERIVELNAWKCIIMYCIPQVGRNGRNSSVYIESFRQPKNLRCQLFGRQRYVDCFFDCANEALRNNTLAVQTVYFHHPTYKEWKFECIRQVVGDRKRVLAILVPKT